MRAFPCLVLVSRDARWTLRAYSAFCIFVLQAAFVPPQWTLHHGPLPYAVARGELLYPNQFAHSPPGGLAHPALALSPPSPAVLGSVAPARAPPFLDAGVPLHMRRSHSQDLSYPTPPMVSATLPGNALPGTLGGPPLVRHPAACPCSVYPADMGPAVETRRVVGGEAGGSVAAGAAGEVGGGDDGGAARGYGDGWERSREHM